jgi:hypothetical protein
VTSQGKLELVAIGYGDSIIAQRRYLLCQERIYRVLDYGDPGTRANVQMALAQGFRQVGSVLSPFHGSPTSTLWVYHAADIEFLAAPESDSTACIADAGPLRDDPSFAAVEAPVAMDGSWASGAFPPDMKTFGWRFPLFASWSGGDVGTGRITIGPFATCGRVVVPFATGPETAHTRLRIERVVDAGSQTLFDGVPPRVPGWRAIRMPGDETCASYLVEARDDGTGWGEWIGVGVPARQVAPPPAGDDAPAQ